MVLKKIVRTLMPAMMFVSTVFYCMGAKTTIDGIVYNCNSENMRASVQGLADNYEPKKVSIPDKVTYKNKSYTVTSIAKDAFNGAQSFTTLVMGDYIETIGSNAFSETYVKNVTFSSRLKIIGEGAFYNCELVNVTLPASLEIIRKNAFGINNNLQTVTFEGSKLTEIGEAAFFWCRNLKECRMPESVTTLGAEAFTGCDALTTINISGKLTSIPYHAFYQCPVNNIVIPASVTSIGEGAFCGHNTQHLYIPGTVKNIGPWAFSLAGAKSVTLCEGITNIAQYAFAECETLEGISLPSTISVMGDALFYKCYGLNTCNLPSTLKTIPYRTFYECGLTDITIPSGVETIGTEAFYGNSRALTISFPPSVKTISERAFNFCNSVTEIYFSEGLRSIGQRAFGSLSLLSVTLPNSVETIASEGFRDCYALEYVYANRPVPCALGTDGFHPWSYDKAQLIVPEQYIDAYRTADEWCRFANLKQTDALESIDEGDKESSHLSYYDINGRRVNTPTEGETYIKVVKHGNTLVPEKIIYHP